MRSIIFIFLAVTLVKQTTSHASPLTPDWSSSASIDPYGRANPYGWDKETLEQKAKAGKQHALNYPVTTTGVLLPERIALKVFDLEPGEPLFGLIRTILSLSPNFKNFSGFWKWMGLHDYPETDSDIPFPGDRRPDYPMGVSLIKRGDTTGLTFSCAVCHSGSLFGKPILGMTNRFSNANLSFIEGQRLFHAVRPGMLRTFLGATRDEVALYKESRKNVTSIGTKKPAVLGLDTALAQVARSVAKRAPGPWAERDPASEANPRPTLLDQKVADSKPAVWWTTKYKTRWLSDGGIVSGSPVITNLVWNELGRGGDLRDLARWIDENQTIVEELTTAIFATQAPKWSEHVGAHTIDIVRAKRGETLFIQNCASCHGRYEKNWADSIDTVRVKYFSKTKTEDVGTDSARREGMRAMADALNPLAISTMHEIQNEVQDGYVPPPLEGIFARFPYFHNNSIPNLCALMTEPSKRPTVYYSGEPKSPHDGFDLDCVGYPTGEKTPREWINAKDAALHRFDTSQEGLSNQGHYEGIFTRADGSEKLSEDEKRSLREFLKTL